MLKTVRAFDFTVREAYHLGEGRMLKTDGLGIKTLVTAYHLGEGRMLKTR